MLAGLIFFAPLMEFGLDLTTSQSRVGTKGMTAGASLISKYAYDASTLATGMAIQSSTTVANGAAIGTATGSVDFYFCDETFSHPLSGWQTSIDSTIEVYDFAVYLMNVAGAIVFVVFWVDVRFTVGGSTVYTGGSGSFGDGLIAAAPMNKMPGGVPPIGCSPCLLASCSMDPQLIFGLPGQNCETVSVDSVDLTATAAGSWRFKEDLAGSWETLPVELDVDSPSAVTCGVTATLTVPTCTNTGDAQASGYLSYSDETVLEEHLVCDECSNGTASPPFEYDHFLRTISYESRSAGVWLLPNLTKSVGRMGDSAAYAADIYRFGTPQTIAETLSYCFDWVANDTTASSLVETEVHPSRSYILSVVGEDPHAIEEPFADVTYAPYAVGSTKFVGKRSCFVLTDLGACPLVGEGEPPGTVVFCGTAQDSAESHTLNSSFPVVEDSTSNPVIRSALDHAEHLARYVNIVANPHASFIYWFPANDQEEPPAQGQWPLDGDVVDVNYYLDTRTQLTSQQELPTEEDRDTRLNLISAPLKESALYNLMDEEFGYATSLWGICRFDAQTVEPPDVELDASSEPSWTLEDCTGAFGSSIVINPDGGITTCALRFDMGSFSLEPYLLPHVCDRISLTWTATNVDELRLYVVDITGYKALLGTVSGTLYRRPLDAQSPQYAGSWAQEHGETYISDLGIDTESEGASLASMTDEERVFSFMLLPGQLSHELRIEIDPVDPGVDVTIDYPTFYFSNGTNLVTHENGHHCNMVWGDGPGVRFGNWAWFDDDTNDLLEVPKVYPPGYRGAGGWKSSALDWFCFANAVLRGVDRENDLVAQIEDIYDANEGQTNALVDAHTISFLTQRRQD